MEDKLFWLQLGKNPKIGPATFSVILEKKMPVKEVLSLTEGELSRLGFTKKIIDEILKCRQFKLDVILAEYEKREIKYVTLLDKNYPKALREIYNPPAILYYKGTIDETSEKIAVIGSRKPTDYGISVTNDIASKLAMAGVTIVSGMAIGIDTIAHQSALEAGGKTIAVLGCGLDQVYPSRNVNLAKEIVQNGAIISEFPIGVPPFRHNFAIRNRIISGLSRGVVVTEAAAGSGSLITASLGLEQNKDIFAVPGPIYNLNSDGPNNLLKMGAKVVTSAADILDELGLEETDRPRQLPVAESEEEAIIINILKNEPKQIDAIIKESKISGPEVSSALTLMEISGKVKQIGGMVYKINW